MGGSLTSRLSCAIIGECGEVCEIFQWKGGLDDGVSAATFSADEIDHIGEELADVLIYSTRLCSICKYYATLTRTHLFL